MAALEEENDRGNDARRCRDILGDVKREDVRAYALRAWHAAEMLKRAHRAREVAERGPLATFDASQFPWEHIRALKPEWPSPDDGREDLAHHVALEKLIDRAASAFVAATQR